MDANDYYRKGLEVIADPKKFTKDGTDEARALFEKAVELDSEFSQAYSELAYVEARAAQNESGANRATFLEKAEEHARKALEIRRDFDTLWGHAIVSWHQGKFDESFLEYAAARELNPNEPDLDADEAEARIYGGEPDEAIELVNKAISNKPNPPYWYRWNLGRAYYMAKRYQDAIDAIAQITDPPKDVLLITAASKAQLEDPTAESDMAEFSEYDPEWSIAKSAEYYYRNDSDRQHWLDGLRKAGLKED
jgi:adenylate cyclase